MKVRKKQEKEKKEQRAYGRIHKRKIEDLWTALMYM